MSDSPDQDDLTYRIRRNSGGVWVGRVWGRISGWFRNFPIEDSPVARTTMELWRKRLWFRLMGYALAAVLALWLLVWVLVARNLPSAEKLVDYQPPLPSMVRGADGGIVYAYARERRVQLRFVDFPKLLVGAYLSAEDKNFFSHGGVDYIGLGQAVVDYGLKIGSGQRARGGSTITQQVAKNILIGNEYSVSRKLKEMILARRIENVLNKQQILELYLNAIPLGRQSFGVQAASRAYFGKDVDQLQLHEFAFLAVLPKAPEVYGRAKNAAEAIERRNWVLGQMVKNGYASAIEADAAKAQPLGVIARRVDSYDPSVGYFVEEVRRQLIDQYGENDEAGPNSVYAGGLWVRTSLDLQLQQAAQDALRGGLMRYASGKGWHGPIAHIDIDPAAWRGQLASLNKSVNYKDWRVGLVLARNGSQGRIGFADGQTAALLSIADPVKVGDVVAAAPAGAGSYALRIVPAVSGGMVLEQPGSGRVLGLVGGFDIGLDSFNRATQAQRQPGSTIKPFVYATALDYGMTPATMVPDQSFCVYQGAALGQKCFRNFGGEGGTGTHTMRWGLEQSRNLMTVHIANDTGMDKVVKTIERVGIGKYQPYLSYALGAGDTTVAAMVNAYSALANGGVQHNQSLVDFIQDRRGKVIWRADARTCTDCNMAQWNGKPMPRFARNGRQVLDPRTAYQVVHMLEGVVTRGTGVVLRDLGLPLFGKTGTTSGPTNVWFVGGSPNIIGGVYLGYDQPRSLGGYVQGGTFAAPMMKQLIQQTRDRWDHTPFIMPAGIRMVKLDRVSGQRVFGGTPGDDPKAAVIWEAFKPETEPQRETKQNQIAARRQELIEAIKRGAQALAGQLPASNRAEKPAQDFVEEQGGVY